MTEKIARRGVRVPAEYSADFLDSILVRDQTSEGIVSLAAEDTIGKIRAWITAGGPGTTHQGYPLVDAAGHLVGVLTRRDLLDPKVSLAAKLRDLLKRPPSIVYADCSLREAADHMVNHNIGRLPVIERKTGQLIGMITRSDLLSAHRRRLQDTHQPAPGRWQRERK